MFKMMKKKKKMLMKGRSLKSMRKETMKKILKWRSKKVSKRQIIYSLKNTDDDSDVFLSQEISENVASSGSSGQLHNLIHLLNVLLFSDDEDYLNKKNNKLNEYEENFTNDLEEDDLFEMKVKEQLESEYESKKKDFRQSTIISKQLTKVKIK